MPTLVYRRERTVRQVETAPSDAALVERARLGDAAAFELLAGRHVKIVLNLLRQAGCDSHMAEDAAQDALVLAFRKLHTLEDPARFGAWLYRIAMRQRPRQRAAATPAATPTTEQFSYDPGNDGNAAQERHAAVRAAVGTLEDPYRLVITLHYLQNTTAVEIARLLDLPEGTVRAQLHRGRELLRDKLRRYL